MIKKSIKILGKEVTLAYCYATEIAYKILSNEEISDFAAEIVQKVKGEQMPDIRRTIFLIIASMNANCEHEGTQPPITDKELMYEASPADIGLALGTIIGLRSEFYNLPKGEPVEEKEEEGEEPKNV